MGHEDDRRERLRTGARAGLPFAVASAVLSLSFGVISRDAGFDALGAIVMSAVVFAGSAQFAAVGILAQGGGIGAAVSAAALMNSRFLPMGAAFGPSLPGGPLRRALQGQAVVDSSWAMAIREGGRFDRWFLFGHSGVQYVGWITGTALGAFAGGVIGDPHTLGLDAIFPAFFVSILAAELRDHRARGVAIAGSAIALALVPFTPPGVPILAASIAALAGLHRRMGRPA
jgi:4-azaleucine resistance transporter AzlC